jgi:hypothetical protein
LKKQSQLTQGGKSKKKKSEAEEEEEINIEALMQDIRREILRVFSIVGDPSTLDAKSSTGILHDIEINIGEYTKVIDYIGREND